MTKKSPATAKKAQRRDVPRVALDMDEIGASLGVSTPSIYLLAERGLLRTFVIGRRRLATIEAVQACARALEAQGAPAPSQSGANNRPAG